jgi:hypothetical protein
MDGTKFEGFPEGFDVIACDLSEVQHMVTECHKQIVQSNKLPTNRLIFTNLGCGKVTAEKIKTFDNYIQVDGTSMYDQMDVLIETMYNAVRSSDLDSMKHIDMYSLSSNPCIHIYYVPGNAHVGLQPCTRPVGVGCVYAFDVNSEDDTLNVSFSHDSTNDVIEKEIKNGEIAVMHDPKRSWMFPALPIEGRDVLYIVVGFL